MSSASQKTYKISSPNYLIGKSDLKVNLLKYSTFWLVSWSSHNSPRTPLLNGSFNKNCVKRSGTPRADCSIFRRNSLFLSVRISQTKPNLSADIITLRDTIKKKLADLRTLSQSGLPLPPLAQLGQILIGTFLRLLPLPPLLQLRQYVFEILFDPPPNPFFCFS